MMRRLIFCIAHIRVIWICVVFALTISKMARANSSNTATAAPIPITDLMLEIHFDSSISNGQKLTDKLLCEQWLNAFYPGRGPWGFGISKTSACRFQEPKDVYETKIHFSSVFLFIEQNKLKPTHTEFNLCLTKLKENLTFTTRWKKEMLHCISTLSLETKSTREKLLSDPRFVRLVAAQLLEQFQLVSQGSRTPSESQSADNKLKTGARSSVGLPSPPINLREIQLFYDLSKSTFITSDNTQNTSPELSKIKPSNVWVVSTQTSVSRLSEYLKLRELLVKELTTSVNKPSPASDLPVSGKIHKNHPMTDDELEDYSVRVEWATWTNYGVPFNSLKSEYRLGLSAGFYFAPTLSMALGYEFKTSTYRLAPQQDNISFTSKIADHSVLLSPIEASFEWPLLGRRFVASISPRYVLSRREISLRNDAMPDTRFQAEAKFQSVAGLMAKLASQLHGNLYLDAQTGIAKNLQDGTMDISGLVGVSWKRSTTIKDQTGMQSSLFVWQDSIQRKMKLNPETSASLFEAILNSFGIGLHLSYVRG